MRAKDNGGKGGGAGIGRMITEGFVANGAKVYICSRKKETIQKTADALTKRGKHAGLAWQSDVEDPVCVLLSKRI